MSKKDIRDFFRRQSVSYCKLQNNSRGVYLFQLLRPGVYLRQAFNSIVVC